MAVSESDVRHVAVLARLGVGESRLAALARELNGILEHMDVLGRVEGGDGTWDGRGTGSATPMRPDTAGAAAPMAVAREEFAPLMKDGFFLVPRLATHEDQGERAP